MNKHKQSITIRVRDFAVLILVPFAMWSCSLTPAKKNISDAPVLPAAPNWLNSTKEKAKAKEKVDFSITADLFPAGLLRDYIPAKVKGVDRVAQKITGDYDVRKSANVTESQLNSVFRGVMKNKGGVVIKACKENNICPLFLSALIIQEAGAGSDSAYAKRYNNVAGRLYKDKKSGKWLSQKFTSVDHCIKDTARHLSVNYVGKKYYSLAKIQRRYCPVGSENDPRNLNSHWKNNILKHMAKIQSI